MSKKLIQMLLRPGMKIMRSGCWMSLGGMGKWRTGWPNGMSQRRIGPSQVMVLPSPFLGGNNVTILVMRTLLFSLLFLPCAFLVHSFLILLTCFHTSSLVTSYTGFEPCYSPLSRLSDALVFSFARYAHFFLSHLLSPFGVFCTPLLHL
jgi:hypothetical protein